MTDIEGAPRSGAAEEAPRVGVTRELGFVQALTSTTLTWKSTVSVKSEILQEPPFAVIPRHPTQQSSLPPVTQ
jgi:hypothetical protein